jgi:hypothetical protein
VPSDTLKFNNSTRPEGMKREDWNAAKVWPLIWHPEQSDVWGDGILLVPWNVTFRPCQADYRALFKHVNRLVDGE